MRRFGWQISGISMAVAAVVVLGLLAFGCGSGAKAVGTPIPKVTPRATPTADARVAEVEAAARRYVQALADSMKTGSPTELDSLSVPGSQAEGNAGVSAHVVRATGRTFVATEVDVTRIQVDFASPVATVTLAYTLDGFDASWPSLQQLGTGRAVSRDAVLELDLVAGQWLVATAN